jgi:hypothetical protein
MNDQRQIKYRLKEAGIYLQYLHEDLDSVEFIRENIASQIDQLLKGAAEKLRKAANLLNLETKGDQGSLQREG